MNSKAIHIILSARNIYLLLFICVIHLGCSSSCRYQMEKGSGDSDRPSGSKMASIPSVSEGGINTQLDEKIKKFLDELDEEDFDEGSPIAKKAKQESPATKKKFEQGSLVTDEEINEVINKLDRDVNIFDIGSDKEYKAFLNEYGSIYGAGFCICGPTKNTKNTNDKIKYISSKQRGFENRCRINKMKDTQAKSCWLIAEDEDNQYYINFLKKKDGKGYIYAMNLDGKSKFFAKNFLDFLDKFFEAYKTKAEEEGSD